jgi:hypothetical protein
VTLIAAMSKPLTILNIMLKENQSWGSKASNRWTSKTAAFFVRISQVVCGVG